ncbi:MAG: GvpL/GvpF family gas vesicle protein [Anaerolineae bacterium]
MKYVYAIVPADEAIHGYEPLAFASSRGCFEVVTDGGLAALVSDSRISDFADLPRAELMRYLILHQRAVESLMLHSELLPVKFGTLLWGTEQVRQLLSLGRDDFARALGMLKQCVETDVAVTWDPARRFAEIGQEPDILALKSQVVGLPAEQSLQARVMLGQLVKEKFDSRRNQMRDSLTVEIAPCVSRWRLNPVMDDTMVMNVACLVDGSQRASLERRVTELDRQHGDELDFRLVGPLPPYSFATVEARILDPDAVERACGLLDLPDGMGSPEQVKQAFYRQARLYHPDLAGSDPAIRARFVRLTEAYHLLTEIAQRLPEGHLGEADAPGILVRVAGMAA